MTQYIHVVKWDKFQRFGDRRVSWVRVYTDLHRETSWLDLTGHQRAVLLGIWLEYAMNVRPDAGGQYTDARGIALNERSTHAHHDVTTTSPPTHLNVTTTSLSRRLNLRVMTRDLESLNQAGFIWFSEHETRQKASPDESLDTQILRYSEVREEPDILTDVGDADSPDADISLSPPETTVGQDFVRFFVDEVRRVTGRDPLPQAKARVGRDALVLLRQGVDPTVIVKAISELVSAGLMVGALQSVADQLQRGGFKGHNGGRGATAADIYQWAQEQEGT